MLDKIEIKQKNNQAQEVLGEIAVLKSVVQTHNALKEDARYKAGDAFLRKRAKYLARQRIYNHFKIFFRTLGWMIKLLLPGALLDYEKLEGNLSEILGNPHFRPVRIAAIFWVIILLVFTVLVCYVVYGLMHENRGIV